MAKKPPVHVSPRENGWAVVREGNDRATSVRRTQAEAAREGRDTARRHETGFLLHSKDGRIREHQDYGSGRRPQEGTSAGPAKAAVVPGTRALGEPTVDEEGRTVQRTTDGQGGIVETAFDGEGKVVEETPVGSVADLPGAEGHEETTDEKGITKRTVEDGSGALIELQIGPDGSVLDLRIPPGTGRVEETTQQVGQAAQDTDGQTADQPRDATGRAAGQARDDDAGGTTGQAQNASGRVTDQDRSPARQTAGQAPPGGQGDGGQRRDEEPAEGRGPNATPAARRKAEKMGVDLSRTKGTGSDGRITAKDVTRTAGGPQERADGGSTQQHEGQRAGGWEAEGGAQDAVGQAVGRAMQGVQGTTEQVTEQARGLVGGLAGGSRQDEERGRGGSREAADRTADQPGRAARAARDTAGRAADQAIDVAGGATGGAAQRARDTVGQATQRAGRGEARRGGDHRQAGGGQESDATDAAGRKSGGMGVGSFKVEGSRARGGITGDEVEGPSWPATRGVGDTAGQAAQEAGGASGPASAAAGPASGDADRAADRPRRSTEGVGGGGTSGGRTDSAGEVRGVTDREGDDVHFEMVGAAYANHEVYGQDGESLGKVAHLFLDEDDRPEYVGVVLPGGRAMLIPTEAIAAENDRRVVVSRPKGVVERGPTFGDEEEVTPELEGRVRKHYGLPISPGTEGRNGPDALPAEGQTEGEQGGPGTAGSGMGMGDTETGEFREHDRRDEGVRQSGGSDLEDDLRMRRSEEELRVGTREREAGSVNVRKRVRTDRERMEVPTRREEVSVERVPVEREASGTEIGGGEARMPVTEEEVVVEKRPVVKEEIRVRKDVVDGVETVEEDVRREEVEIDDRTERRGR